MASVMLAGCAPRISTPCRFYAYIDLDRQAAVNDYCWPKVKTLDNGQPKKITTMFNGCTHVNDAEVHSIPVEETIGHEVMHIARDRCGIE